MVAKFKYLREQGCAKNCGQIFFGKFFFVNMDVYFQNMAISIRSCNYASQGAIKSQKVSLIRLSVFLKNSLINRHTPY